MFENEKVIHNASKMSFGSGVVVKCDGWIITVRFETCEKNLDFRLSMKSNFLTFEDNNIQKIALDYIDNQEKQEEMEKKQQTQTKLINKTDISERGKKAAELIQEVYDKTIGFIQIGESSFVPYFKEDYEKKGEEEILKKAVDAMYEVTHTPPDFDTIVLDEGFGALLIMNGCTELILPEELKMTNGNIDLGCALNARVGLLEACERGELWQVIKNLIKE